MAKRIVKPDCKTCIYRSAPGELHECDYAWFMRPHTRKAVPKEQCTHYRKGPRLEQRPQEAVQPWKPEPTAKKRASPEKNQKKKKAIRRFDWGLAWDLYHEQNATDREIMDALGCSRPDVARWRKRNHLPVHPQKGRVQKRDLSETVRRIQKRRWKAVLQGEKETMVSELRHMEAEGCRVAGEAADTIVLLLGKIDIEEEKNALLKERLQELK